MLQCHIHVCKGFTYQGAACSGAKEAAVSEWQGRAGGRHGGTRRQRRSNICVKRRVPWPGSSQGASAKLVFAGAGSGRQWEGAVVQMQGEGTTRRYWYNTKRGGGVVRQSKTMGRGGAVPRWEGTVGRKNMLVTAAQRRARAPLSRVCVPCRGVAWCGINERREATVQKQARGSMPGCLPGPLQLDQENISAQRLGLA